MHTVQAAEDLVLCAMVRSAITAALGLPFDAAATTAPTQARPALPAPQTLPGTPRPLQPAAREPPRPQAPHVAQVATAPTFPTAASAQPAAPASSAGQYASSTSAASVAGNASTSSSLAAASGGSLAALIGQPLPMASDAAQPAVPASAVAPSSAAGLLAASQPLPSLTIAPHIIPQPVAASASLVPGAAPAASTSIAPVGTHHQSATSLSQPALAVSGVQQQLVQPLNVGLQAGSPPQAPPSVSGLQATPTPGLPSSSGSLPAASAVGLPYSPAQQQPQTPVSAGLSQPPHGSNVQTSANGGPALPSGGQPRQAGFVSAVRPVGPGQQGAVGQGRATGGQQKAPVGDDVWQLASDVMAAGGTATTAAAVTTAAQQVNHLRAVTTLRHVLCRHAQTSGISVQFRRCGLSGLTAQVCCALNSYVLLFYHLRADGNFWSWTESYLFYREPYPCRDTTCLLLTFSCQKFAM